MSRIAMAGLLFALTACASDPAPPATLAPVARSEMTQEQQAAFLAGARARMETATANVRGMAKAEIVSGMRASVSNRTHLILQEGHGVYLEYTDAQGRLFMWYPGNRNVVSGTWGVVETYSPPRTCFKYLNAVHGVTGEYEPNECVPPEQVIGRPYDLGVHEGDPFNLASGKIPYLKSKSDVPAWPD
ncbi:MAG TPA: hypothetical protein VGO52_18335 [Hyphomonadaceae bacterium]|jgi:hypothetical protein|nr:hypothetical protein [Hyphomonadaceae bacterium]